MCACGIEESGSISYLGKDFLQKPIVTVHAIPFPPSASYPLGLFVRKIEKKILLNLEQILEEAPFGLVSLLKSVFWDREGKENVLKWSKYPMTVISEQ